MAPQGILTDSINGTWSYLLSIDWEEPWLWVLVGFQIWCSVLTLMVLTFNAYRSQVAAFLVYLGLVYSSEYINEWASINYKLFSEQQYFDSNGLFISLLFSFPLLTNALVIVVYWMWDVINVMINLKRAKVKQQLKFQKQAADQSEAKTEKTAESLTDKSTTEKNEEEIEESQPENKSPTEQKDESTQESLPDNKSPEEKKDD